LSVSGRTPDIVTYGALNHGIANLCRRLSALGVAPGRLYGLHIADDLLYIAMMLALEYLGAATVIVADPERVAGWPIDGMFVWGRSDGWAFPVERIDQDWLQGDGTTRWWQTAARPGRAVPRLLDIGFDGQTQGRSADPPHGRRAGRAIQSSFRPRVPPPIPCLLLARVLIGFDLQYSEPHSVAGRPPMSSGVIARSDGPQIWRL